MWCINTEAYLVSGLLIGVEEAAEQFMQKIKEHFPLKGTFSGNNTHDITVCFSIITGLQQCEVTCISKAVNTNKAAPKHYLE